MSDDLTIFQQFPLASRVSTLAGHVGTVTDYGVSPDDDADFLIVQLDDEEWLLGYYPCELKLLP